MNDNDNQQPASAPRRTASRSSTEIETNHRHAMKDKLSTRREALLNKLTPRNTNKSEERQ